MEIYEQNLFRFLGEMILLPRYSLDKHGVDTVRLSILSVLSRQQERSRPHRELTITPAMNISCGKAYLRTLLTAWRISACRKNHLSGNLPFS